MTSLVQSFLDGSSLFLQVTSPTIKARMKMNFDKIPSPTLELAALERLKSINSVVTTQSPSFFIGSSSFLQETRTTIKS